MVRLSVASAVLLTAGGLATPAFADPVYIALGDSITFGETTLEYIPSFGDRGYVGLVADAVDAVDANNGATPRPTVINLAIDGETAESFQDGTGRTPPVVGRTDAILAGQNLNYAGRTATPQSTLLTEAVVAQTAIGNTIDTVSITLGFNELAALTALPNGLDLLASTLSAYQLNFRTVLTQVRDLAPDADLYMLTYFNPFPGDPGANPADAIFATGGPQLNAIIQGLAIEFGAFLVDTATPFVGREAELTFIDEQPADFVIGDPFGGVEPIGNVHPNDAGYAVIAAQFADAQVAVPEPATLALFGLGAIALGAARRRRG